MLPELLSARPESGEKRGIAKRGNDYYIQTLRIGVTLPLLGYLPCGG
jgi:hypothetical protein